MKIQVKVTVTANKQSSVKLELDVALSDTVASLKERVAALQLIPFPDQDLMLEGEVLADSGQLSDGGVKEQSSLDFVVKASETTLVQQLKELLQARDLSCDELGLLYCYKNGVSVTQALQTLGLQKEKLQDFVRRQKGLKVENNHVALVREDTSLKPFSVADEVETIIKASSSGVLEIKDLCTKFTAKFNISLASIAGTRVIDFLLRDRERFIVTDRKLVSLRSAGPVKQRASQQAQSGGPMPVPPASPSREAPAPAPALALASPSCSGDNQQYLDLHSRICSRNFSSKSVQALADLAEAIQQATFLNVDHVVKGGAVGKGIAISGSGDGELVFFLKGLPRDLHDRWAPPLLRAVANTLAEKMGEETGVEVVSAGKESVALRARGLDFVEIRFSPTFGSDTDVVAAMGEVGPEHRKLYSAALVEERVQFIARQPVSVKMTIRLLKWWRDQQRWSNELVRPSDDVLELVAVYAAVQAKPADQRAAMTAIMALFANFNELRIVWSNYYAKGDVWAPLLRQQPLLMDPVNPYVNTADPQVFDACELMELARTTHFFW